MERPGAPTRLADPVHTLLTEPVEHALRGPVRVRRVGQRHDHFLDAAGILQAHHLTSRDTRRVGVDVPAHAQKLASRLQDTRGIPIEAVGEVGAGADVGHARRFRIEISLDAELGSVVELEFQRQSEVASLPWSPAIGSLHGGGARPVARAQAVEAGHDRLLQGGLARLVRPHHQVHGGTEAQVHALQAAEALDLDSSQSHA